MKYLKFLIAILVFIGCNNEADQTKTTDTTVPRKTPPPFQVIVEREQRTQARALAITAVIDSTRLTSKGDTLVYTSETKTGSVTSTYSYKVPRVELRYKGTTTTPPVQPPTTEVKFLELPIVGPQDFSGKSNLIFENKQIANAPGVAFKLYNGANNITIRNCFFNKAAGILVELENARNITIENCLFNDGWSGVYALASSGIKIINCQFVNAKIRRKSDGTFNGLGNFMQFNSCSDIQVLNNKGENFPEADPEDMISFFNSSNGVVKGNMFRGNPQSTWSTSGGGLIAGDHGGNNVILEENTLMSPGNYGMAIAGGTNMIIRNNKIYSERNAISNNPLYVWNQFWIGSVLQPMSGITVTSNRVYWIDKNGGVNNGWNAGNGTNIIFQAPTPISFAEMGVPVHLIDKVTPTELLTIRGK